MRDQTYGELPVGIMTSLLFFAIRANHFNVRSASCYSIITKNISAKF